MSRKPVLTNLLCEDARQGKKLNPTACQTCISPCAYGQQWLKELGINPADDKTGEQPVYSTGDCRMNVTLRSARHCWSKSRRSEMF